MSSGRNARLVNCRNSTPIPAMQMSPRGHTPVAPRNQTCIIPRVRSVIPGSASVAVGLLGPSARGCRYISPRTCINAVGKEVGTLTCRTSIVC